MTDTYDSTDDKRTEVPNGTRQNYRELSTEEKSHMMWLKQSGQEFIDQCRKMQADKPEAGREFALAITHMEDAVMRAVRGVTQ